MRIAIMSQSYPPMVSGAALFAEKLAEQMAARGHEVLVMAASDKPYPYRLSKQNLQVARCRSYRNPFRVGQRFALWPHHQITSCLAAFSPNVIHLHDPFQSALSSLFFGHARRIPVMMTIHALPNFVSASFQFERGIREVVEAGLWRYAGWILKNCAGAVVATRAVAEEIYSHTGSNARIISCGVDLNVFKPAAPDYFLASTTRRRLNIPEQVPVILYVGRLDKDKQVERVVQAAAHAMQKTQAYLLVVGDGTEKARLERLCDALGIGERCLFTGFISLEEGLPALYQIATVFATASEIETQGLVLLEAAACALPIVAVQATCLHEIVHEGCTGFLLPSGDTTGMAECMVALIQDPIRAQEMGLAARRMVESHAAEKTFDAYEDFYITILEERRLSSSPLAVVTGRAARSGGSG